MKKILTVSLVAIMAVGAAHAQIASTDWTMEQLGTTEAALQGKIDEKVATTTYAADKSALESAIGTKVAQSDYDAKMLQVAQDIASKVAKETYDTKIGEIETTLQDVATNTEFTGLTTKVTALETSLTDTGATGSRIVALETAKTTMSSDISGLDTRLDTAEGEIDTLQGQTAKIGTVTEGKTVVEMIADAQAAATYDDTAVKNLISAEESARTQADTTMSGQIDGLGTRLTTAETDIDNLEESLTDTGATGSRIKALETAEGTMSGQITALQTKDTELADDISGLDGRLTTAEGEIDDLQTADTTMSGQIDGLGTRLGTAEGEIADLTAEKVAIAQGQNHAVMTTDAAGNVIPVVPTECEDAESFCVLTSNGVGTYKWENIARATKTSGGSESGEQE